MPKRKKNVLILLFFIVLEIFILINPNILITSVNETMSLFLNKIFISLFPFFILNEILLEYNLAHYIEASLKINITKIFKVSKASLSIIILSLLSGHPSNAKYIKDAIGKKVITEAEATKLLMFTFFPSPVFVVTVVGYLMFDSILIGIILLLIVYFINFALGFALRNKLIIDFSKAETVCNNTPDFSSALKNSIINSFNSLLIILGNILVFTIILNIFTNYISLPPVLDAIVASTIELTGGIKKISELSANFSIKFSLLIFALIFSGVSIHSQASSILSDFNINYKFIIKYRLIASVISSALIFLILNLL